MMHFACINWQQVASYIGNQNSLLKLQLTVKALIDRSDFQECLICDNITIINIIIN